MRGKTVSENKRIEDGKRVQIEMCAFLFVLAAVIVTSALFERGPGNVVVVASGATMDTGKSHARMADETGALPAHDPNTIPASAPDTCPGCATSPPDRSALTSQRQPATPPRSWVQVRTAPTMVRAHIDGRALVVAGARAGPSVDYALGGMVVRNAARPRGAPSTGPPDRVCRPAAASTF